MSYNHADEVAMPLNDFPWNNLSLCPYSINIITISSQFWIMSYEGKSSEAWTFEPKASRTQNSAEILPLYTNTKRVSYQHTFLSSSVANQTSRPFFCSKHNSLQQNKSIHMSQRTFSRHHFSNTKRNERWFFVIIFIFSRWWNDMILWVTHCSIIQAFFFFFLSGGFMTGPSSVWLAESESDMNEACATWVTKYPVAESILNSKRAKGDKAPSETGRLFHSNSHHGSLSDMFPGLKRIWPQLAQEFRTFAGVGSNCCTSVVAMAHSCLHSTTSGSLPHPNNLPLSACFWKTPVLLHSNAAPSSDSGWNLWVLEGDLEFWDQLVFGLAALRYCWLENLELVLAAYIFYIVAW